MPEITLHQGDCLEVLRTMPDCSVDACVTDPPYGLAFMGKKWDYDVPTVDVWREVLRVLKPGGHLLAFAGTRTQHRMAVAIEDAGFEIRDMIAWVYGSGFPKSLDVSKALEAFAKTGRKEFRRGNAPKADFNPKTEAARQWAGWGTALKPALEPITVARKPLIGTVAANMLQHGTGALNVDWCRVAHGADVDLTALQRQQAEGTGRSVGKGFVNANIGKEVAKYKHGGRWPANLIHDGSDEVVGLFPVSNGSGPARTLKRGQRQDCDGWGMSNQPGNLRDAGTGSAARFFYCAKASRRERGPSNDHPTVKPQALMAYLCRLVTQPNGIILDPFAGSGSTLIAARSEGFSCIGIERERHYCEIAEDRLAE